MERKQYDIHKEVILKCQSKDRAAQNKLYGLYSGAMFNICRRMVSDHDEAKDLLQEVFIDVFTKIDSLKEISTFSAWIKRITINKCINALKKKRMFVVELTDESERLVEEQDSVDKSIIGFEASQIMKAIDQISEGCRTVLNLYLFDGYDHKEISQILGISESASKSQYCKAKMKIRSLLSVNKQGSYGN